MLKQTLAATKQRKKVYQSKLVFYLFLLTLAIFFASSLIIYVVISWQARSNGVPKAGAPGEFTGPYQHLEVPVSFWVSCLLLLAVSGSLHLASRSVRYERIPVFRRYLIAALVGALAFTAVQFLGMYELLEIHFSTVNGSTKLYGMSFTLAMIHALHVFGGIAFLYYTVSNSLRGKYDHEEHCDVDNCASYWHFLDIVWVCMLLTYVVA